MGLRIALTGLLGMALIGGAAWAPIEEPTPEEKATTKPTQTDTSKGWCLTAICVARWRRAANMIECGWIARPQAISIPAYALTWATISATLRRVVWITRVGLPRCSILERPMPFAAFSSMNRDDRRRPKWKNGKGVQ